MIYIIKISGKTYRIWVMQVAVGVHGCILGSKMFTSAAVFLSGIVVFSQKNQFLWKTDLRFFNWY